MSSIKTSFWIHMTFHCILISYDILFDNFVVVDPFCNKHGHLYELLDKMKGQAETAMFLCVYQFQCFVFPTKKTMFCVVCTPTVERKNLLPPFCVVLRMQKVLRGTDRSKKVYVQSWEVFEGNLTKQPTLSILFNQSIYSRIQLIRPLKCARTRSGVSADSDRP